MRAIMILLGVIAVACQSPARTAPPKLYGVIFQVQVSPNGVLEAFNVSGIVDPFGSGVLLEIDPDWLAASCTRFSIGPNPTYTKGEDPQVRYIPYFYDKDRPKAIFGEDPEKPVIFVPSGYAEWIDADGGRPEVCRGEIGRPAA